MKSAILLLLTALPLAAQDAAVSAKAAADIQAWAKLPRDSRPEMPSASVPLTKGDAAAVTKSLWEDHAAKIRSERSEEMKAKVIKLDGREMKFEMLKFGDLKKDQPLFISMHGGGNAPPQLNDSQWENQIKLGMAYKPAAGIYLAPRAPTNTWNLWHEAHIDKFFDRLIENLVVLADVDPNKVYFMGYSAGGDGTYQLAPRMADRLAAAAMMAGHPNETSPLGLRNIGFTIHVGGEDGGFNRNKIAAEWAVKLADLQKADPKGYPHWVHVHEGRPHWMNLEDKEAIPWMEKFTRNPLPEKIVWQQDDVTHDRFYWLAVPQGEAKGGQNIVAERDGQKLTVTTKGLEKVTVLLSDALVNMDEPVSLTLNGKTLDAKKPQRTAAVIRRTLEERGDPALIFSGEITAP
jgi:predicted esterase